MLIIRQAQLDVFQEQRAREFEKRAASHLRENFPEECAALGDEGVRKTVSAGWARSGSYGFVEEFHILHFLNFMMMLGADFDKDPEFASILKDSNLDSRAKINRMDEQSIQRLSGPWAP